MIIHEMRKSPARQFVKVEHDFELGKIFSYPDTTDDKSLREIQSN